MSELCVWMNGERVGAWSRSRGSDALTYEASWLESPRRRPLSLSLPFTATRKIVGDEVGNYFDNLLPDAKSIRDRMGRRFGVKSNDAFELLSAIGRDCVGAVQLLPPGMTPEGLRPLRYDVLDEAQIEQILVGAVGDNAFPLGAAAADDDTFRISLAGAQEKTALLRVGKQWCQPHGSTPTTHILKLPLGLVGGMRADMSDSVENEWLCLRLLDLMGLPSARTEILAFGDQKVLSVERFDREWMDDQSWIARLPQEDFCQATGAPPGKKYEKDGGPGIAKCMSLLASSIDPLVDRSRFLLSQLAFWMLGATDGHAKNFSVFLQAGGTYALTPLYDVLSAYPIIGQGTGKLPRQKAHLAMSVRGKSAHSQIDYVKTRHWISEARRSGVPDMLDAMIWLATCVPDAIKWASADLPQNFPEHVWESITTGLTKASLAFLDGLSSAS